MARIVGAIATSHTPTIGFAYDKKKQDDPVWAPILEAYRPIEAWLAAKKPDVLLFIYNDHITSFFFDHYSAFALGIGDSWSGADEGGGHVRRLDRCLYDTGSAASGRDCPPSARTDVRVARFRGFSADANGDVGDHPRGGPENSAEYQGCGTPWEYPSEERCSNDHLGRNAGRRRTLARKSRSLD